MFKIGEPLSKELIKDIKSILTVKDFKYIWHHSDSTYIDVMYLFSGKIILSVDHLYLLYSVLNYARIKSNEQYKLYKDKNLLFESIIPEEYKFNITLSKDKKKYRHLL
jgi:hypothetical protein